MGSDYIRLSDSHLLQVVERDTNRFKRRMVEGPVLLDYIVFRARTLGGLEDGGKVDNALPDFGER